MEIHKPKPFHNWREFLKEYAIIVLGVLTALAADQAVDAFHHRAQVADMTQKLQEESRSNLQVLDYDIGNAQTAVAGLERTLTALATPAAAASAQLPPSPNLLAPGDSAWLAIQDSALLPIMPKLLIANYWKIERSTEFFNARVSDFHGDYRKAQAALDVFQASQTSPTLRETLLLRLSEAQQSGRSYIGLAQRLRAQNQWALDGKEIDLSLARQLSDLNGNHD
ncbi:MAG: hypothetical protein JO256_12060 [Alphaproteobacteria bacterium]|nr:hypothetical protein [Alphaproteobacteria bacterium]